MKTWRREQEARGRTVYPLPARAYGAFSALRDFGFVAPSCFTQVMGVWWPMGARCFALSIRGVQHIESGSLSLEVVERYLVDTIKILQPGDSFEIGVDFTSVLETLTEPEHRREVWISLVRVGGI